MKLVGIPPDSVGLLWERLEPGIDRLMEKGIGTHTPEEIRAKACAGEWLLFVVINDSDDIQCTIICSVTTGIRKVFECGMIWGNGMAQWLDEIDEGLTRVARELGCDVMAITGRRGWIRTLADRGFSEKMVTVTRDL